MVGKIDKYLKQLLSIHWLRPETALWRSIDCAIAEQYEGISGRSVDLGCGDGLLSFVMAGGKVDCYDVFMDVTDLSNHRTGADIYNTQPVIGPTIDSSELRYKFDLGIDHKEGLVARAKCLTGFYSDTLVQDLNKALPFEQKSFNSAFSNILYWLDDLNKVLIDWGRVITDDGRLIVFVPGYNFKKKSWLYYDAPHWGKRSYLNFFDRGYAPLIKHCYNQKRWTEIFNSAGFRVSHHRPYLSDEVMELWNIGTRPIAQLLIHMASRLQAEDRQACKEEWVGFFHEFLSPIAKAALEVEGNEEDCAFHFFVLEKNR